MTNTAIKRIKKNNQLNNNMNNMNNMNMNQLNNNNTNNNMNMKHYTSSPNNNNNNNNNMNIIITRQSNNHHQQQQQHTNELIVSPNNNNINNTHNNNTHNNNTNIKSSSSLSPLRNVPTITDKEIENIQPIINHTNTLQSNNINSNINSNHSNGDQKFLKTSSCSDFKVQCKAEGSNVIFTFDKKVNIKRIRIKTPGNRRGPQYYSCFIPIIPNNISLSINNNSTSSISKSNNRMKIGEGILEDLESLQYLNLFTKDEGVKCKELICTFCPFEGQKSFKIIDMKIECN